MKTDTKHADEIAALDVVQIPGSSSWMVVRDIIEYPSDEEKMVRLSGADIGGAPVEWHGPASTETKVRIEPEPEEEEDDRRRYGHDD